MGLRSNTVDYLAELREFHRQAIEPHLGKPIGCTEDEVEALQTSAGFELPLAYKQFLLWMGKDYYGIFQGTDWFIDYALSNTKYLPHLLAQDSIEFELSEHFLAFFGHQGYMTAWFELPKTDDNPNVWFFSEAMLPDPGDVKIKVTPQHEGRFTDFLQKDMQDLARNLPSSAPLHLAYKQAAETGRPVTVGNVTVHPPLQRKQKKAGAFKNLMGWLKRGL